MIDASIRGYLAARLAFGRAPCMSTHWARSARALGRAPDVWAYPDLSTAVSHVSSLGTARAIGMARFTSRSNADPDGCGDVLHIRRRDETETPSEALHRYRLDLKAVGARVA